MSDDYGEPLCNGSVSPDYEKDPDSTDDYSIEWAPSLLDDTLLSSTWTLPDGLTQESVSFTANTATIWVSGGTCGVTYRLTNRVVTAGGRTRDKTIRVKVSEQ